MIDPVDKFDFNFNSNSRVDAAAKFTVVMPCYNEEKNIPLILSRFQTVASKRDDVKLLLVDNGSTDGTAAILAATISQYQFADTLRVPVNKGYGYGILRGLEHCQTDFVGWTHADMQTDPGDIVKALEIVERNNFATDVYVKGERRGRPLTDSFFTAGMSIFESCFLGSNLWDINAQPNIFHRDFFQIWRNPPEDFALDLYAYYFARQKDLRIIRFDVTFPERIHGQSKWNTGFRSKIKFIQRTLEFSLKLKKNLESV